MVLLVDCGIKWCLFCFKVICELKANNWVFEFACNSIVHQRRMVKFIYVTKDTLKTFDDFKNKQEKCMT